MIKRFFVIVISILIMCLLSIKAEASFIGEYDLNANIISKSSFTKPKGKSKTNLSDVKSKKNIYSGFDHCEAVLVIDDIYYIAYNYGGTSAKIVTLNESGDIVHSGELGYSANFYVTHFDDRIYVVYNKYKKDNNIKETYCKIFDVELNELASYNITAFSRDPQYFAVNKNGIIYKKAAKVYSVDFDGKNKKVILDLAADCKGANSISALAANNDYAAFTAQGNGGWYYGVIDLKTNKAQIINDDKIFYPRVYGNYIMFPSQLLEWDKASGKIVVYNGNEFKTIEPKTQLESGKGYCAMTTDGKVITQEFSETKYGKENMCIRVYNENGKCLKEIITEKGFYLAGNNELIVYSFIDKNPKRDSRKTSYVTKIIEY